MSKYQTYQRRIPRRSNEPHPVWRGIGCLIMLIIPALAYSISVILIQIAPSLGILLPAGLLGYPVMPAWLFQVPGLVGFLHWIQSINNLYAILVGTLVITVFLMGALALGYAFIYRLFGPPRYSPLDAPPPNIKVRKYRR